MHHHSTLLPATQTQAMSLHAGVTQRDSGTRFLATPGNALVGGVEADMSEFVPHCSIELHIAQDATDRKN